MSEYPVVSLPHAGQLIGHNYSGMDLSSSFAPENPNHAFLSSLIPSMSFSDGNTIAEPPQTRFHLPGETSFNSG
jgi:hypothetical protein